MCVEGKGLVVADTAFLPLFVAGGMRHRAVRDGEADANAPAKRDQGAASAAVAGMWRGGERDSFACLSRLCV